MGEGKLSPEEIEESQCTCGAGHGSLEGHMAWCEWLDAQPKAPPMVEQRKLTGRQMDALRAVGANGAAGAKQSRLAVDGISRSLLMKLYVAELADWFPTAIGNAWFVTTAGRAALNQEDSNAG